MDFIILDSEFEYRVDAHNIIKSVLKDESGNPILREDLISKISDNDISEPLTLIQSKCDVELLPEVGSLLTEGVLYCSEWGLLKCRQSHDRTIYDPIDIPALFSYYRGEGEGLEWIQNEYVFMGWGRVYEEITYTVIQEHQTQSDWTPDVAVTLWQSEVVTPEISEWVQPGSTNPYMIGDQVYFPTISDSIYKSLIDNNVWSPTAYPAGWDQL